ncbi:MAG TPA: hypothetical protein VNM92_05755 [Thermoanaerobaculia bacterium]|nr:hypothetical protein [Thermoanaerobaculia bacterium]
MDSRQPPQHPPMGKLDAIEIGERKLTIQTEFFGRPGWRIETKVYLAGALKKVYTDLLEGVVESDLQQRIDGFHQGRMDEIVAGLEKRR